LPGKPDIVFCGPRVAVFCDGDFWHGRNWPELQRKLAEGTNPAYWRAKIETNMERDQRTTVQLEAAGWTVVRLWETDTRRNPQVAAQYVADVIQSVRLGAAKPVDEGAPWPHI
jgi:DNA mismatch endonuclease (patch repair protein)